MPESICIRVDGEEFLVPAGSTLAAALASHGRACRRSVRGELRGPLCGMGICCECRVEINGILTLSCQILCEPGMEVRTSA
jgi:D-hydroxyproline dehydrogenase subunit gamma